MNSTDSIYKKEEKRIIKYHHKLLLADLLYVNYVHSNFEYDGVTIEDIYRFVTKGTRYNGLEQLEIIEEAKLLFKIKYNKIISFNKKGFYNIHLKK